MFPFFNGFGGFNNFGGCGPGGCYGGWGFGGPCGKCGHCCYCNRNSLLLQAAFLAASCCRDNRGGFGKGFADGAFGVGKGADFGGFGGGGHGGERRKETPPEDLRGRRGGGRYR
jgi:hypothetical protein